MVSTVSHDRQAGDKKGKAAKPDAERSLLARAGRAAAARAKRPAAPKERVDYIGRTRKYFQGVIAELKRVHWPGLREVGVYTAVVLLTVGVLAILMWIFDTVLGYAFHFITRT
jgi:preprotein translocase subunit SecE